MEICLKEHSEENVKAHKEKEKENVSPVPDVDTDDDIEDIDDPVNIFLANRRKGFTRANPAAPPEPKTKKKPDEQRPTAKAKVVTEERPAQAKKDSIQKGSTNNGSKRYCKVQRGTARGCKVP